MCIIDYSLQGDWQFFWLLKTFSLSTNFFIFLQQMMDPLMHFRIPSWTSSGDSRTRRLRTSAASGRLPPCRRRHRRDTILCSFKSRFIRYWYQNHPTTSGNHFLLFIDATLFYFSSNSNLNSNQFEGMGLKEIIYNFKNIHQMMITVEEFVEK